MPVFPWFETKPTTEYGALAWVLTVLRIAVIRHLFCYPCKIIGFNFFFSFGQGIRFFKRFQFLNFFRQLRSSLSHIQLARDHVSDQAGAVFTKQFDFLLCTCNSLIGFLGFGRQVRQNKLLFLDRRTYNPNSQELIRIKPKTG